MRGDGHELFVYNFDERERELRLAVTRRTGGDDEHLLEESYTIGAETGRGDRLAFEFEFEDEDEYELAVEPERGRGGTLEIDRRDVEHGFVVFVAPDGTLEIEPIFGT